MTLNYTYSDASVLGVCSTRSLLFLPCPLWPSGSWWKPKRLTAKLSYNEPVQYQEGDHFVSKGSYTQTIRNIPIQYTLFSAMQQFLRRQEIFFALPTITHPKCWTMDGRRRDRLSMGGHILDLSKTSAFRSSESEMIKLQSQRGIIWISWAGHDVYQ